MRQRVIVVALCVVAALGVAPASALTTTSALPSGPFSQDEPTKPFERFSGDRQVPNAEAVDPYLNGGFTFVPINPYRTFDSRRYPEGRMFVGDEIIFSVLINDFGEPVLPPGTVAVTYNLTVTGTFGGGGYLAVFPADIAWPGHSSINWFGTGLDLANGGVSAVGSFAGPGEVSIYCGGPPGVSTYFVMDITGFYI